MSHGQWANTSHPLPARPWWRRWSLPIGFLLMVAIPATAIAIVTGDSSVCENVSAGNNYCSDRVSPETWFSSPTAGALARGMGALAFLALPVIIGLLSGRRLWLLLCPVAVGLSVIVGYMTGPAAVRHWYPELYWDNALIGLIPTIAFCVGVPWVMGLSVVGVFLAPGSTLLRKRAPMEQGEPPSVSQAAQEANGTRRGGAGH